MEIEGQIIRKFDLVVVSEKFKKQEFVLRTSDKYPQEILIQMSNDNIKKLDEIDTNENVTAHINIRGRAWTSPTGELKYFNTIECWKLDVFSLPDAYPNKKEEKKIINNENFDDLPF